MTMPTFDRPSMVLSAKSWSASGSVVRPGEPMIEIVGKHRFVVARFPVSRLYRLQVGDAVTVSTGGAGPARQDRQGQCHC
jgi:multidrug resistance efflux pump